MKGEFEALQDQLSGVEQYAMRYLEAERAHINSQELRLAEVSSLSHPLFLILLLLRAEMT